MNDHKYCPSCGEVNPSEAAFCANCGKQFGAASVTGMPSVPPSHEPPYYEPIEPPKPPRRFKKRYVLYGVVGLFILLIVAAAASPSSPSSPTVTPTPTAQASVAATQAKASATPTVKATSTPKPTPTPAATPMATPTPSGPALTAAQIDFLQSGMEAKGYTFTEPLKQDGDVGSSYVGSTFYKATMSKDGIEYRLTIEVCKDKATADSQFAFSVSNLEGLGFKGNYDRPTQWTGVMALSGTPVGATSVESASSAPYMVTTIMGTYE